MASCSPAGLLIDLGQIQVQLGVVVPHPEGFLAERFAIAVALLGNGSQQSGIGKIKRVLRSDTQRAPRMQQGITPDDHRAIA